MLIWIFNILLLKCIGIEMFLIVVFKVENWLVVFFINDIIFVLVLGILKFFWRMLICKVEIFLLSYYLEDKDIDDRCK